MIRRLYSLLTVLLAPAAFAVVLFRGLEDRAYWANLRERFGWGRSIDAPSIWLHAVSLGEVSAASPLVRALRERYPGSPFVLSTATPTGRARAHALFGADADVRFLPYDTPGSMRRFLSRIRPRLAIIMETEIWPNLLRECRRRGVPVVFASARLTAKSTARYRRFSGLFGEAFAENTLVAAQTADDAERFVAIGAERSRTHIVGNVKFDMSLGESVLDRGRELRKSHLGARPVWVAGSTHGGEEEQLVSAHRELQKLMEKALLVLVPRHPQRFESVARMLTRERIRFERRSIAGAVPVEADVWLVDTMGELAALYAAADAAFVGGSLIDIGGHNLLEPAALGVPVITGPYTDNSKEIARLLRERGGAVEVRNAQELTGVLSKFLADPAMREEAGRRGREFVESHRGSVARLVDLIEPVLRTSGAAEGS